MSKKEEEKKNKIKSINEAIMDRLNKYNKQNNLKSEK
jgi:hypothetical protein